MKQYIKQIGFEGRTTIPQQFRDAMGIKDGDFIAFELSHDGKALVISKAHICPRVNIQIPRHDVMITGFVPSGDPEELRKALFIAEHILGLRGEEK